MHRLANGWPAYLYYDAPVHIGRVACAAALVDILAYLFGAIDDVVFLVVMLACVFLSLAAWLLDIATDKINLSKKRGVG